MLKIGLFSKLSRISIRMLRYYDENGLLTPGEVDPATGYRYYHESQLMEAERLLALREMGFGVEAMGAILRAYQDPEALGQFLRVRREELRAELEKTRQRLALLETTLERVGKDGIIMEYNVTLKELPRRQVASLREVIPSYWQEGELWGRMMTETAGQNLQIAEPCYSIAIFHDKEYREENVDVEVQMAVKGDYRDTESVRFFTAEPQTIASVTVQGSYQQMGRVNQVLASWIAGNGCEINGPMFNIYHVGPAQTADESQWVTEVCMPVEKK